MVSHLKKEIINEVKVLHSEKDKDIEILKSQVTLLQNHVGIVKHTLDKNMDKFNEMSDLQHLDIEPYFIQITKRLNLVPEID